MTLGVPTRIYRKVGVTFRSLAGLLLVLCMFLMSITSMSRPEQKPLKENVKRNVIPKEYQNTCYKRRSDGIHALLPEKYLVQNDCQQRLPQALVLGAKKCGTGALRVFLDTHPSVVFSRKAEPKFFTQNYQKGLDWYRDTMRQTTPSQVAIEKSPGYLYSNLAARRIQSDLSTSTKFIVILCNPVRRTVSDFTFEQLNWIKEQRHVDVEEAKLIAQKWSGSNAFEKRVLTSTGRIRTDLDIINHSMFDRYIMSWMKTFPRSRFLFVDGDNFTQNPVGVLNEIERFLDVPSYFNASKFYFDRDKGFYCLSEPFKQCLKSTKGLQHPPVDRSVLRKLRELFKPHDFATRVLTLKNFTWMKDDRNKLSSPRAKERVNNV